MFVKKINSSFLLSIVLIAATLCVGMAHASRMTLDEAVSLAVERQTKGISYNVPFEPEWQVLFDRNMRVAKTSNVLKTNSYLIPVLEALENKGHQYFNEGKMTNARFMLLHCTMALMFSPENLSSIEVSDEERPISQGAFSFDMQPNSLGSFKTCFTTPKEFEQTFDLVDEILTLQESMTTSEQLDFLEYKLDMIGDLNNIVESYRLFMEDPRFSPMITKMRKTPLAPFIAQLLYHRCLYMPFVGKFPYTSFGQLAKMMSHRVTFIGIPTENCDYDGYKKASPAMFAFHDIRDHSVGKLEEHSTVKDFSQIFNPSLENDPFFYRLKRLNDKIEALETTEKHKAHYAFFELFHEDLFKFNIVENRKNFMFGFNNFNPGITPEAYYDYFLTQTKVDHGAIHTSIVEKVNHRGIGRPRVEVRFKVDPSKIGVTPNYGDGTNICLSLGEAFYEPRYGFDITMTLNDIYFDEQTSEVAIYPNEFKAIPQGDDFKVVRKTLERKADYQYLKKLGLLVPVKNGAEPTSSDLNLFKVQSFSHLLSLFAEDDKKPSILWPETLWEELGVTH